MKAPMNCLFLVVFVSFHCLESISCEERNDHDVQETALEEEHNRVTALEQENNKIIKVKVALYMESLCPGCHAFIKKQLFPVFMKYYRFIQLDLVPYGNARHSKDQDGKWVFTCQHGAPECLGNMYLACATHILQKERPKHLIRYYNCLADAGSFSISKDVKECAPTAGVNFRKLETCVHTKGPELLAMFGDRTNALQGRRYVPAVAIDDEFDTDEQDEILSNLLAYLCKSLKGRKPAECKQNAEVSNTQNYRAALQSRNATKSNNNTL